MDRSALTFVTVVFEPELLLRIQARSMARSLPPALAAEVVVVDNTAAGLGAMALADLRADLGPLADRLRVVRRDAVARVPHDTGWRVQQVLKLMIADQVGTPRYVALDAKNHFVGPLDPDTFVAADGRPRASVHGYRSHPLRAPLERVLRYVGLEPADHIDRFTATVTPFVLDTAIVRALVRDVESTSGRTFAREFVTQGLTEFFLYTAWILARGSSLDEAFAPDLPPGAVVWPHGADAAGVSAAIAASRASGSPFFAVHRTALRALEAPARGALAEFWAERGLFSDVAEAATAIVTFQRYATRAARWTTARELPYRVRAVARRAVHGHRAPPAGRDPPSTSA